MIIKFILVGYIVLIFLKKLNEAYFNRTIITSGQSYNLDADNLIITFCFWDRYSHNNITDLSIEKSSKLMDIDFIITCFGNLSKLQGYPHYMKNCRQCILSPKFVGNKAVEFRIKTKSENKYNHAFIIVHENIETPVLDGSYDQFPPPQDVFNFSIVTFQKYERDIFKKQETYNQCYLKCLSESYLNHNTLSETYSISIIFSDFEIHNCRNKCNLNSFTIWGFLSNRRMLTKSQITTVFNVPKQNGTITFYFENNIDRPRILFEKTGLTMLEIVNELGTIIGFSFGLSLIIFGSFMFSICQYIIDIYRFL